MQNTEYRISKLTSKVICTVFVWWVGLVALGSLSPTLLTYQPSFPYFDSILPATGLPQWLYSWANFDGVHYLTIIQKGYIGTGLIQAFFPAYPWLIRMLSGSILSPLLVGLTVNLLFIASSLLLFKKLLAIDHLKLNFTTLILVVLLFPTSFFFASFYNESFFLFLTLATFLAARKKYWLVSGLLAAVASATRVVGILLIPALVVELIHQIIEKEKIAIPKLNLLTDLSAIARDDKRGVSFRPNPELVEGEAEKPVTAITVAIQRIIKVLFTKKKQLFFISLGSLGLLSYMAFLYGEFKDPLYFFSVQNEFGAERTTSLVLYPQVVWRYIKILLTVDPLSWKYYSILQEFIFGVGGMLLILYSFFKTRASYATFSLLAFVVPTLTGTFSSMPRYALVSFSIFIVLAQMLDEKPKVKWMYYSVSVGLLILNTVLFIQGYWVS